MADRCSFCGKRRRLIEVIKGIHICTDCLDECNEILNAEKQKTFRLPVRKPKAIKALLDDCVIGQEQAKKVLAVAAYNHQKRCLINDMRAEVEMHKSNVLLVGPSDTGKTLLVQSLAAILDVPVFIADATKLTGAGYVGEDVQGLVAGLLEASGFDLEGTQRGIIYVDEIDKLACKEGGNQRDVSGEGVQQALLKLIEGGKVRLQRKGKGKGYRALLVDTSNILFISSGAFVGMVQETRVQKPVGFGAGREDAALDDHDDAQALARFGLIPELVGRLPVVVHLSELNEEDLVRVLTEPKSALTKQYRKLLKLSGVKLSFTEDALRAIARKALERSTGARGLRAVMEDLMLDVMFDAPSSAKARIVIDAGRVTGNAMQRAA